MVRLTVRQTGEPVANKVYIGDTHVPIQAAIDYAHSQGGGTIFIEHGVYLINNTANAGGVGAQGKWGLRLYSNIKLTGEYFGTVLKPAFANDNSAAVVSCVGTVGDVLENIVIEALLIGNDDKETAIGGYGIYVERCGLAQTTGLPDGGYDASTVGKDKPNKIGVTIRNCIVQGNNTGGIALQLSFNCTVTGNTTQNNIGRGINLSSSNNNTIAGNVVQNNSAVGIHLSPSSNNNSITGNTLQNNSAQGINIYSSSNNNTVTGNTAQNNSLHGIYLDSLSSNNTVTGNTVQNNIGVGIGIPSSNNTVTGNTVQNNNEMGIYLNSFSNNNVVTGNIAQSNADKGILLAGSSNSTVTGNICNSIIITGTGTGNLNAATHNQQIA